MTPQDITRLIQASLECSVYLSPTDPGLTYEEIIEVCKKSGLQAGEVGDALQNVATLYFGGGPQKILPHENVMALWGHMSIPRDPDYRNIPAFDFADAQLKTCVRAEGVKSAKLERKVLVERAVAQGILRSDVEAAIAISVLSGTFIEKDGFLRFAQGREHQPSPSQQCGMLSAFRNVRRDEVRVRAYENVKDIIGRRTDGRPRTAEPLDAFAEALDHLGYGPFRLWWTQTVAELHRTDMQSSPLSVSVLSAALVEAALTFVVRHAKALGLGVLGSKSFDDNPRTWRIEDLVTSAAAGRDAAILDDLTRRRADSLIRTRQRIHAGRMLSDFPHGVLDLRPDEAREARSTAEQVVRRVLDWLERFPPNVADTPSCGALKS